MNATAATSSLPSDIPTDPGIRRRRRDLSVVPTHDDGPFGPVPSLETLERELALSRPSVIARCGARIVDGGLYCLLGLGFGLISAWTGADFGLETGAAFTVLASVIAISMLALFIYQTALLARTGQTLGKKWIGLKVVDTHGEHAGFVRAFLLRELLWNAIVVVVPFVWLVDVALAFFGQGRTLHDYISGTRVIEV